jgi:hypothetical protein
MNQGPATITIAGVGTGMFTDAVAILSSYNTLLAGPPFNGQPFVLIATIQAPDFTGLLAIINPVLLGYDLRTSFGPLTGPGGAASGPLSVHHTTLGDLSFSLPDGSQNSTFTATTVPEPSTVVLLGTGLITLVGSRFRRRN